MNDVDVFSSLNGKSELMEDDWMWLKSGVR
jgi:hypothetical protein